VSGRHEICRREFPIRNKGSFAVRQTTADQDRLQMLVQGELSGRRVSGTAVIHERWTGLDCRGSRSFTALRRSG
jgi:hypothetical protein